MVVLYLGPGLTGEGSDQVLTLTRLTVAAMLATFVVSVAVSIVLINLHRRASSVPLVGCTVLAAIFLAWLVVTRFASG